MKPALFAITVGAALAAACGDGHSGHGGTTGGPAAPSMLTAAVLAPGVHLTWKDNATDEDGFDIMRKEGSGAYAVIMSTAADVAVLHDATAASGKTYTYMVHAKRGGQLSQGSNEASVSVP